MFRDIVDAEVQEAKHVENSLVGLKISGVFLIGPLPKRVERGQGVCEIKNLFRVISLCLCVPFLRREYGCIVMCSAFVSVIWIRFFALELVKWICRRASYLVTCVHFDIQSTCFTQVIVGKSRPFREILVMPRGRIWAGGGECEERASKTLFKLISRINLFISNMIYEVHTCSPRFTKVTILPAPLK